MRRTGARIPILAAAILLGACGTGDGDPKRAVDARTEAIHFFPADQPFVAFLDTTGQSEAELSQAVRAVEARPALAPFAAGGAKFVRASGLDLGGFAEMLVDDDPDDGVNASQAAFGIAPSASGSAVLIVLVSDQVDAMEEEAESVAETAGMSEGDAFDDARVFSSSGAALAVRDGVVVIAPDTSSLRSAIGLRDANQDEQLDEDQVSAALRDLPPDAPMVAYANPPALLRSEPETVLRDRLLLDSIEEAGIGVSPLPGRLRLDLVAKIQDEESARGLDVRATRVDESEARAIVGARRPAGNEFRDAVLALAPFSIKTSVSDEDLRATIVGSR